ncbi:MAG: hypothetical protein IPG76_18455 [Acidobacteria bacterium]|nr:hypothetical protein [Acidobacteriota bacterium]
MQQGRVLLDSDWNELCDIIDYRIKFLIRDLFNIEVPDEGGWSRIVVPPNLPNSFKIDTLDSTIENNMVQLKFKLFPGRAYVDGICVMHQDKDKLWDITSKTFYENQPFKVYIDVWEQEVTYIDDPGIFEPAIGVDTCLRMQTCWNISAIPPVELNPEVLLSGGYSGDEYRLYRIDVHAIDKEKIYLKISRNNGSTVCRIIAIETIEKFYVY